MKQQLGYKDGKSNKFWEVKVKGKEMIVRHGKIDTEKKIGIKIFDRMS
jgi:predicted DNA-binding WGR domain protein